MCEAAKNDARAKALVDEHMHAFSDMRGGDILTGDAHAMLLDIHQHPSEGNGDAIDLAKFNMNDPLTSSRIQSAKQVYDHQAY